MTTINATNTPQLTTNGQLLIGHTSSFPSVGTLTASTNITVTNGAGSITLASKGGLLDFQIFTSGSSATYTPTTGTNNIIVEAIGGGGAGGGAAATTSAVAAGGGGAGGGYFRKLITGISGLTGTYTVGLGGTKGSAGNNAGNAGSDTTFTINSVTYTAKGGGGGGGSPSSTGTGITGTQGTPGSTTSGDINVQGGYGSGGFVYFAGLFCYYGNGGGTIYSQFTSGSYVASATTTGIAGQLYGGGGTGGANSGTQSATTGNVGAAGVIIVWEFS